MASAYLSVIIPKKPFELAVKAIPDEGATVEQFSALVKGYHGVLLRRQALLAADPHAVAPVTTTSEALPLKGLLKESHGGHVPSGTTPDHETPLKGLPERSKS